MPGRHTFTMLMLLCLLFIANVAVRAQDAWKDATCPDAEVFGQTLIDGICWDGMFPITVLGTKSGGGPLPPDADHDVTCTCPDPLGVPEVGLGAGYWSMAFLFDVVRKPYCSPALGGVTFFDSPELWGGYKSQENDNSDKEFRNYNSFSFPLLIMLEILITPGCESDGRIDMDMLNTSPTIPTWNDDELAFIMTPEAILYANPIAIAFCMTDGQLASANIQSDKFRWCAGFWGNLHPLTGNVASGGDPPRVTSLLTTRAIAASHRRGFSYKTVGKQAQCGGQIYLTLPKSQYRLSQTYPLPEADPNLPLGCTHPIGASQFLWGEWRNIPGVGEDFVHMLWRYTDCCVH